MIHTIPTTAFGIKLGNQISYSLINRIWVELGRKQQVIFCNGDVKSSEEFAEVVLGGNNLFFVIFCFRVWCAVIWLNDFDGYCARGHFAVNKKFYGHSKEILGWGVEQVFRSKRIDGTPVVKTLVGIVPKTNRPAIKAVKRIGFHEMGEIPDCCYISTAAKTVPGVLLYMNYREIIHGEERRRGRKLNP